jgi:hypothetical protein
VIESRRALVARHRDLPSSSSRQGLRRHAESDRGVAGVAERGHGAVHRRARADLFIGFGLTSLGLAFVALFVAGLVRAVRSRRQPRSLLRSSRSAAARRRARTSATRSTSSSPGRRGRPGTDHGGQHLRSLTASATWAGSHRARDRGRRRGLASGSRVSRWLGWVSACDALRAPCLRSILVGRRPPLAARRRCRLLVHGRRAAPLRSLRVTRP